MDCGAIVDGYYGDAAITVPVGEKIDPETARLLRVTEASLQSGIAAVKPGATLGDIGAAVQSVVEAEGFRWFGILSATGSARRCMRIRRCLTLARPAAG